VKAGPASSDLPLESAKPLDENVNRTVPEPGPVALAAQVWRQMNDKRRLLCATSG
jgi:hypothetical protein